MQYLSWISRGTVGVWIMQFYRIAQLFALADRMEVFGVFVGVLSDFSRVERRWANIGVLWWFGAQMWCSARSDVRLL